MSWAYTDEAYKEHTRQAWNASSPSYNPWLRALAAYDDLLVEDLDPQPRERVLDVATGPGEPALSIAQAVGPGGEVLGVDISEGMIERARTAAEQRGIDHASFVVGDAEDLDLADDSFPAAVCRFSLQIFADPAASLAEVARVLEPGGRFSASVWAAPGERSPALHAVLGPMLRHCTPDESGYLPTPYELGGPRTLLEMTEDAGLAPVRERRVSVPLRFQSREAYMEAMLEGTPIGHSLSEESQQVQQAVIEEAGWFLDRWGREEDGELVLDSEAVLLLAERPS